MRSVLISFIAVLGCAAAVGASPKSADNALQMPGSEKGPPSEATLIHPVVPVARLIDEMPDGARVIQTYQAVRTVSDLETANARVKAQVIKAQAVASDVGRLHAAAIRSCEDTEVPQVDAIGVKAKAFTVILVRVDKELTKALIAMRHKVEAERPTSIRAKEDVNRLSLATHELGRLRVQAQDIAKTVDGLAASIRTAAAACTPILIPPLFADRTSTPSAEAPPARSSSLPPRRTTKRTNTAAP